MRPLMMTVRRQGPGDKPRDIKVCIEPTHPRFMVSLAQGVKDALVEEDRYKICEVLSDYFNEALDRGPEDPIEVTIGEDTYALHQCTRDPKKVRIKFA